MMGRQSCCQKRLFYSSNLEDLVTTAHPLRGSDPFLDLSHLRGHFASFYSATGRYSVDPSSAGRE